MKPEVLRILLEQQRSELTEYHVYKNLAKYVKLAKNKKILNAIAKDELRHHNVWKKYTKRKVKPNRWKVWKYTTLAKVFGLTFGLALMERAECQVQEDYGKLRKHVPEIKKITRDQKSHEGQLISLLHEEKLHYVSSIVLGLNDALVELTGALAGLTFALQNSRLIGVVGLITGIAASLSMASSEYLSTKQESDKRSPFTAAAYTGIAYFFTVLFLIFPFFLLSNHFFSLAFTVINAIVVILLFTYYISVTKSESFSKRFMEMLVISLGVAGISFVMGVLVRMFLGVDI